MPTASGDSLRPGDAASERSGAAGGRGFRSRCRATTAADARAARERFDADLSNYAASTSAYGALACPGVDESDDTPGAVSLGDSVGRDRLACGFALLFFGDWP